jgi:hypothetical protein
MWFYFARVPNTKVTATARKHLMGTVYKINQAVYQASIYEDIDLSTPDLANITFNDSLSVENTKAASVPIPQDIPAATNNAKAAPDSLA